MLKRFTILALALPLMMAGCKSSTTPTPPLAPGYTNSVDQSLGESLAAARAFYNRLQTDYTSGTFKPSNGEKAALNDLALAINAAEPVYLAFHNGTGTQAAAQAAISNVTMKQTAVQSQITSGVN